MSQDKYKPYKNPLFAAQTIRGLQAEVLRRLGFDDGKLTSSQVGRLVRLLGYCTYTLGSWPSEKQFASEIRRSQVFTADEISDHAPQWLRENVLSDGPLGEREEERARLRQEVRTIKEENRGRG